PEVELRHRVLPDVSLNLRLAIRQHEKVRLPERADGEDPSGRDRLDLVAFELVVRPLAVRVHELRDRVAPLELARIDLDPEFRELREVGLTLLDLFFLGRHKNMT